MHWRPGVLTALLVLVLVLVPGAVIAEWAITLGGYGDELGHAGLVLTNSAGETSGYVVVGYTESFGASGKDVWVVRLDIFGKVVWQKRYGDVGDQAANDVAVTPDGNFVITGWTSVAGEEHQDVLVLVLDSDGKLIRQQVYGNAGRDVGRYVLTTPDDGYVIAGITESSNAVHGRQDIQLVRFNFLGRVVWSRVYGGTDVDHLTSFEPASDRGFLLSAHTYSFAGPDAWFAKLSENGTIQWQKLYRSVYLRLHPNIENFEGLEYARAAEASHLIEAADGSFFAAVGIRFGAIATLKLDAQGQRIWEKVWYKPYSSHWYVPSGGPSFPVDQTSKDEYIIAVAGTSDGPTWLMKLDSKGEVLRHLTYPINVSKHGGRAGDLTSDDRLLLIGGGSDMEITLRDPSLQTSECPPGYEIPSRAVAEGLTGSLTEATVESQTVPVDVRNLPLHVADTHAYRHLICPPGADVGVSVNVLPNPAVAGHYVTYTSVISNHGPSDAAGITLKLDLSADLSLVSVVPTQGSCHVDTSVIACQLGDLAFRESATVTVVAKTEEQPIDVQASVSSEGFDPILENNSSSVHTKIQPEDSFVFEALADEGRYPAMAVDNAGALHIAYAKYDSDGMCQLFHVEGRSGAWITTEIGRDRKCWSINLAIDSEGFLHVAYLITEGFRDYIRYGSNTSGDWQFETVTDASQWDIGMSVDIDGAAHISYYKFGLKYINKVGGVWSTPVTIDTECGQCEGMTTSIVNDSQNRPHISYVAGNREDNRYATQVAGNWQIQVLEAGDYGSYGSDITVDTADKPHISYHHVASRALHYATNASGDWVVDTVDGYGVQNSIAVDPDAKVHLVYEHYDGLKYATNAKGEWTPIAVSPVDGQSDIAIDSNGRVHVVYNTGYSDYQLYYAKPSGPDTDVDGVSDYMEAGPSGDNPAYDGNDDGAPDAQQGNVVSLPTNDGQQYVTLAVPEGVLLLNVRAINNPSPADMPAGADFPFGFFSFEIAGLPPGGEATLTLYLPEAVATYYKYGPTPNNPNAHWYEFLYANGTGAVIDGHRVELRFVDGQRGDDDLLANGIVIEPGSPEVSGSALIEDRDGDGLPDAWETENGLDPTRYERVEDPDEDSLYNLMEYQQGTHPRLADTDEDGMEDGYEYYNSLNPLIKDHLVDKDSDGFVNEVEMEVGTDPGNSASRPESPVAETSVEQEVESGMTVALEGGGSWDPNHDIQTYQWAQIEGPSVALTSETATRSTFVAPPVDTETLLRFRLQVTDIAGLSSSDVCEVRVMPVSGDLDGDGVPDSEDNCTLLPNGPLIPDVGGNSQRDTDGDGYGNVCDPDFDNSGNIDFADLAFMKSVFFSPDPDADLDGNGSVDFADLAILKSMFFSAPGPSGLVP